MMMFKQYKYILRKNSRRNFFLRYRAMMVWWLKYLMMMMTITNLKKQHYQLQGRGIAFVDWHYALTELDFRKWICLVS